MSLATAAVVVLASACSGSPAGPSGAAGSLNLMIKDSPYSDAKALLVTFSEVTIHRSDTTDAGWSKLPFAGGATSRTCDLKQLVNAEDVLGVGTLAEGHYQQIRLQVSSATLYFDNAAPTPACAATIAAPAGKSASVEIPSGQVKLNRGFDVTSTGATTILIDFDGDRSVNETGNGRFRMTPVIGIVSVK
jgi:hypothetical protein